MDRHLAKRRKQHLIRVQALDIVDALTGGNNPTVQALKEKLPEYMCTCGEGFDTLEEANYHRTEALKSEETPYKKFGHWKPNPDGPGWIPTDEYDS
jgi:hypothetical protein